MFLRRASDHLPKMWKQQPENGLSLAQGPTRWLGVVGDDGAGAAAYKTAARAVIKFLHRSCDLSNLVQRHRWRGVPPLFLRIT
jgi:hypothetical protein